MHDGKIRALEVFDNYLLVAGEMGLTKIELNSSRDTFGVDGDELDASPNLKVVCCNSTINVNDLVVHRVIGT